MPHRDWRVTRARRELQELRMRILELEEELEYPHDHQHYQEPFDPDDTRYRWEYDLCH